MKLKLTILALALFITRAYAQTSNTLSVMYAPGSGDVNIHGAIGDFGYHSKPSKAFGLIYTRQIKKALSLETGLTYSQSDIEETSFPSGKVNTYYDKVNLVTIPLLAKFTFFKYLYADLGFDLDFQTNYKSGISVAPKQSGVGFEGGLGAKYSYKSIMIFVSPYFQYHGLIKFNHQGSNHELINSGVKLGVGYNF
ncbi:outer membrane beta-barrel protein [Mucilaginibacter sp. UYCu711]|uniref:outer membrane beta-barrel protein n=1 Tax=Mucilaginibacter sp. UYCu711 TaxID=3156339 RepID=UPI003D19DA89